MTVSIRPQKLSDFIGQEKQIRQLKLVLDAAKKQNKAVDHILLSGPPGLGKTTLASIVAKELNRPLKTTSGPIITHAGDLASLLSCLGENEIFFIDEIHRINKTASEMLYMAMEDYKVDIMVGKGPAAQSIPLDLAPFTLIGATTRPGALAAPLRDRFGVHIFMDFYTPDDLTKLLQRSCKIYGIELEEKALSEIAKRSRGTARIANRLLKRVIDYIKIHGYSASAVNKTLEIYEIDKDGLDKTDRAILETLINNFAGNPTGISSIAATLGLDPETLEQAHEPYLVRQGYIQRTPRGRVPTGKAYNHLNIEIPKDENMLI